MPAATNIVINDGKPTPMGHTFVPSKVSDLIATYPGPGSTLASRENITVSRREATPSTAGKVKLTLTVPVENTVDGLVVADHQSMVTIEFVVSPKSTSAERKDIRVLAANLLLNATVADVVDNGNGIY